MRFGGRARSVDTLEHQMLDFCISYSPVATFLHYIIAHYLPSLFWEMNSSRGWGDQLFCLEFPTCQQEHVVHCLFCVWNRYVQQKGGNTFNWLLSFAFLECLLPLLGSTHAVRGVCREGSLCNKGSECLGNKTQASGFALSTLLAQSFCSLTWGWSSSLLVYFKEPTCSAQTSSLGESPEPVTAARAVLAVAMYALFPIMFPWT